MNRKIFLLALPVIGVLLLALNACQKDSLNGAAAPVVKPAGDRAPDGLICGVTLFNSGPCDIVTMDQNTGTTLGTANAFYIDPYGNNVPLDNLKGICRAGGNGPFYITTGYPVNPTSGGSILYNNSLFRVNPATGQTSYLSTSTVGTVSDLEYDPISTNFYGLRSNSNAIVEIVDNANSYGTYNGPFAINGIAIGYTLQGISLVRDNVIGTYLVGCATDNSLTNRPRLYRIPMTGGTATFITELDPAADLTGGHGAIGFDLDLNAMLVNRNSVNFGLNRFAWNPPFAAVTNTAAWSLNGFNFEDLTSSVY